MNSPAKPLILVVDDDSNILKLTKSLLSGEGYDVMIAESGLKGLEILRDVTPDLILLDIMMPEMDGYDFCYKLQQKSETAFTPVVFVTALKEEKDRAKAFALGAVGYLIKPIKKDILLENVRYHLKTALRWKDFRGDAIKSDVSLTSSNFIQFKEFLSDKLNLSPEQQYKLDTMEHASLYSAAYGIGIDNTRMSVYIADYLKLPFLPKIKPEDVELGILPVTFCKSNLIVALKQKDRKCAFILSNPFNLEVIDILEKFYSQDKGLKLVVTPPASIESILHTDQGEDDTVRSQDFSINTVEGLAEPVDPKTTAPSYNLGTEGQSTSGIANKLLFAAASERASDIHIELKKNDCIIRFRIDGDMRNMFILEKKIGFMLIGRFKAISGMDIAERRRPQDGTLEAVIDDKNYKLRLATASTPEGENIVIRMLQPYAKPKKLNELGMTDEQADTMMDVINRTHGLILVVGPTGSGKTTTIYSLLSHINCQVRNLVTIEDPVEYLMPFANQQQVNEKAGITFEALLKSVVRLDPDVIFLGEIRDQYSAKMAMDFASTGHLTLTTLHTTDTTTAVFRLERLGIGCGVMADAVLCVVAQRLVKKLCSCCKKVMEISSNERNMFMPFTDDIPARVAHPVGCAKCHNTGYFGREGLYEVLKFDPSIARMVRSGKSIVEIRKFFQKKGIYLISNHAIEKVKGLICAPEDVYQNVLAEDMELLGVKS